jgi:uncharacterized protein (TIGR02145 family)
MRINANLYELKNTFMKTNFFRKHNTSLRAKRSPTVVIASEAKQSRCSRISLDCFGLLRKLAVLAMTVALLLTALPAAAQYNLTLCEGQSFMLTSDADGHPDLGQLTYTWKEGVPPQAPGTVTVVPTLTVTGKAAGIYTYMCEVANSACTLSSSSFTVEVVAPPAPTNASANARCGAGMVTFSATAPDGSTIDWYTAATGGSTVSGGYGVTSFSPSLTSTTSYYAQSRNTTTGCVSTSRTQVTGTVSNTVPDITRSGGNASQTVNHNSAITTIVYSAPNSTFTRSGSLPAGVNGNASSNSYTISGTPSATGKYNYTVTATYSPGGCTATSSGTITVKANCAPDASATPTVCAVVGSQQWSNPRSVVPVGCTSATNLGSANPPTTAYYRSTGLYSGSGYLYNWKCVNERATILCPSPWRVPTSNDFCTLDKVLFGTSSCTGRSNAALSDITDKYVTAWGGVYGGFASSSSDIINPGSEADYWSSTGKDNISAYGMYFNTGGNVYPQSTSVSRAGYQVRCVK